MECKADYISSGVPAVYIGIYPEWNVKGIARAMAEQWEWIGIYPEWNVKKIMRWFLYENKRIGIYPEWNVKYNDM